VTEQKHSNEHHSTESKLVKLTVDKPQSFKNDALSGLTVAFALVPEAIAFSFVAGVSPKIGLYAAFIM
jgi:SulP family sulfate permease